MEFYLFCGATKLWFYHRCGSVTRATPVSEPVATAARIAVAQVNSGLPGWGDGVHPARCFSGSPAPLYVERQHLSSLGNAPNRKSAKPLHGMSSGAATTQERIGQRGRLKALIGP